MLRKWKQRDIYNWAKETFPDPDIRREGILLHLRDEVMELMEQYNTFLGSKVEPGWLKDMEHEVADVYILLAQFAESMGISIEMGVYEKMEVNMRREWNAPDENGIVTHKEQ